MKKLLLFRLADPPAGGEGNKESNFSGPSSRILHSLLCSSLLFAFFPLFLPAFSFSSVKNVVESSGSVSVINSAETKAEGSNAKTESRVSTTVNGQNVTVETDQPGSVEVKNINGKVEIKTSAGITPTIIITGVPTQNVEVKEKEQKESPMTFSEIINNRTSSIYSYLKGFFKRVFGSFLKKT